MNKARTTKGLVFVLLVCVLAVLAFPGFAQDAPDSIGRNTRPTYTVKSDANLTAVSQAFKGAITMPDGRIQVIVQLADAPAITSFNAAGGRANGAVADAAAAAQRRAVRAAQTQFINQVSSYGATALNSTNYLLNTVTLAIPRNSVSALRLTPGVVGVFANHAYERTDTLISADLGADKAWGPVGGPGLTGKDVVVAVIDDGLDYTHTHFGGPGDFSIVTDDTIIEAGLAGIFPATYPIVNIGDPKIVGGWDFVGNAYTGDNAPVPDPNPLTCAFPDFVAHGTGASSFIGGWGVNADGTTYTGPYNKDILTDYPAQTDAFRIGPGMAPEVALVGLRLFGCDGFTSDDLIVAAIEAAVAGEVDPDNNPETENSVTFPVADIINMSLGCVYNCAAQEGAVEDLAIDAAVDAGVIVVASAGNEYDNHYITGAPAASDSAISVAATINYGNYFAQVTETVEGEQFLAFPGALSPLADVTAGWIIAAPANACTPLTNAAEAAGKIVVVFFDGVCGTIAQGNTVEAANGAGMLVVGTISINGSDLVPSMGTSQGIWETAAAVLAPTDEIKLASTSDLTQLRGITDFSSRGPARGRTDIIKPDVAAPGNDGVSAAGGTDNETRLFGGTSQAAPVVAGVMALLREEYPNATVQQLKAMVINGANRDLEDLLAASGKKYSMVRQGSGLTNVTSSLATPVIAYNKTNKIGVSVSFGHPEVAPGENLNENRKITVENLTNKALTYKLKVVTRNNMPGVQFSVTPKIINVPKNGKVTVNVKLKGSPAVPNGGKITDATLPLLNGTRYYFTEETGFVELSSPSKPKLRVPLYAAPRPAAAVSAKNDSFNVSGVAGELDIPLEGTGVNTGNNYPDDILSLVSVFEQVGIDDNDDLVEDAGDVAAVGVASNAWMGVSYFAFQTYGEWEPSIENFVEIGIDSDQDALLDWVLTQCFIGDYFDDTEICFVDVQGVLAAPGALLSLTGAPFFLNDTPPDLLNTYALNTNVLVIPYPIAFFDAVLVDLDSAFDFVVFEDSFDSLDSDVVGPFTADWNRPTVAPVGFFTETMPVSVAKNNGKASIAYNFGAPGSYDLLLIHHHNGGLENKAETVTLNIVDEGGFDLVSPANDSFIRDSSTLFPTWEDFGADTYTFSLFQISGNALVSTNGERLGGTEIVGTALPFDGDAVDCIGGECVITLVGPQLPTGTYTWTVTSGGTPPPLGLSGVQAASDGVEAANGPFTFTVDTGDFSLLKNGGFESDANNDKIPDGWVRVGAGQQRCKPGDADSGSCAYYVKGSSNGSLNQNVKKALLKNLAITDSDTLVLAARVKTKTLAAGAMLRVSIKYAGVTEVHTIDIPLPADTAEAYLDLEAPPLTAVVSGLRGDIAANIPVEPNGNVTKLSVKVIYKGTAGSSSLFIDNVSLTLVGTGVPLVGDDGAPVELPSAPGDLRGN